MALLEDLKTLGVNTDEGLERLGGNSALYERMLVKFLDVIENSSVQPDFDNDNYDDVIEKAHAIKGVSGNLSLTPIYKTYTDVVALLRAGEPEKAKEELVKVMPVQNDIVNCIKKYL